MQFNTCTRKALHGLQLHLRRGARRDEHRVLKLAQRVRKRPGTRKLHIERAQARCCRRRPWHCTPNDVDIALRYPKRAAASTCTSARGGHAREARGAQRPPNRSCRGHWAASTPPSLAPGARLTRNLCELAAGYTRANGRALPPGARCSVAEAAARARAAGTGAGGLAESRRRERREHFSGLRTRAKALHPLP